MKYEEINKDDLFYVCSFLVRMGEYSFRSANEIARIIGKEEIRRYYEYADVFHCEDIDKTVDEAHDRLKIGKTNGLFFRPGLRPAFYDMAMVYQYLIQDIYKNDESYNKDLIDTIYDVFTSKVGLALENYKNCLYWQSGECIYDCYIRGDYHYDMI